jgi:hypothetical protein
MRILKEPRVVKMSDPTGVFIYPDYQVVKWNKVLGPNYLSKLYECVRFHHRRVNPKTVANKLAGFCWDVGENEIR